MSEPTANLPREARHKALQEELKELADVVGPGPLVDLLLERAFEVGATDIHFDPLQEGLKVRLRVDGILHDILQLGAASAPQVISRMKLLAGMDITERRLMQDGHFSNTTFQHQRDVRTSTGPTIHGERLVLRLMPDATVYTQLEALGLEDRQRQHVEEAVQSPHGMVLCAGPVGCGKTTTVYSCLSRLNEPGKSLVTIEDPVERRVQGTVQVQIDPKAKFGFVEALRGVLRQDPNVILVGEIRDPETAHIAARAALTGIQVLSTLHAHDTVATIDVFREFGIPPMFIADSITCIIAQRLMRKVCQRHRETFQPDSATAQMLGINPEQADHIELVRGIPHDENFHTGYFGRTGIFEVLRIDADLREAILNETSSTEIHTALRQKGLQTLEQSAINKVLAGVTTVEEMHRVLV